MLLFYSWIHLHSFPISPALGVSWGHRVRVVGHYLPPGPSTLPDMWQVLEIFLLNKSIYLNFSTLAHTCNKSLAFELTVRLLNPLKKSIHVELILAKWYEHAKIFLSVVIFIYSLVNTDSACWMPQLSLMWWNCLDFGFRKTWVWSFTLARLIVWI